MSSIVLGIVALLVAGQPADAVASIKNETAADAITLRDGKVLLGEIVEAGVGTSILVRRAWIRENLPEWSERWEAAERQSARRNQTKRKEHLTAWRRERSASGDRVNDAILTWIDTELDRLRDADAWKSAPLMLVKLGKTELKSIQRVPRERSRLLRLAWTSQLPNPETLKLTDLKDALQGRGFDVSSKTPIAIDALRPPQLESDATWNLRRAATELSVDSGLRFLRYQGMLLPEPAAGQPLEGMDASTAIGTLKQLLGDDPGDPLPGKLRDVERRGRIVAMVTRMDIAADFASVTVEMTMWVRQGPDRWVIAGSRASRVQPDDLAADAGKDLAADPQVSGAFKIVDALGLGNISAELKRRSLKMGAATQKAIGEARAAVEADLAALILPVHAAPVNSR